MATPAAADVRVVLDVPREVRAGMDIAGDFEDHPGAVQEAVAVTDGRPSQGHQAVVPPVDDPG